jgi:putative nucleotidyltransferase with HDIG domain
MLFIVENISNITTDLKLEEYNNINHPLLIKLNEVAPGTYQHTMSLAVLAEKCALSIGANPLLTKLGAYFHDIGKISRPDFFAENQFDSDNKLYLIPPKKAAEIIRKHVTEGIRIAKEYKLPQSIIDFIPMHHGTSLIRHFYAKALEESPNTIINENEFRYPGPKPNNKETAILMICDSSEAISRIATLDRENLEELIIKSIEEKLLDGQFNETTLSLKELDIIKNICIKNIAAASHQRIEYKEIPNDKKS